MGNQLIADSLRLLADGQIGRVVFTEDALRRRTPTPPTPISSPPNAANAPAFKKATL